MLDYFTIQAINKLLQFYWTMSQVTVACRNIGERVEQVRPANFLRSWACEKNFSHDKGYLSRNVEIWVNAVLLDDVLDDYEM